MRKIVLAATVVGAALILAGCGNKVGDPVAPDPSPLPTVEELSAADKAAVDALGDDVAKLKAEVQQHTGTARGTYAFKRMNEAMRPK
jgi:outer membrane murein-binding lipoprotein Lpp